MASLKRKIEEINHNDEDPSSVESNGHPHSQDVDLDADDDDDNQPPAKLLSQFDEECAIRIKELKLSGRVLVGDCGHSSIVEPDWLDKEKWARAKVVGRKYFFCLMFIHMAGLILLVHVKTILVPLLWTQKSKTVPELFLRYLSTLLHVKSWYEGDVWNPEDPAHRSVMQVRGMHKRVATAMNAKKIKGKDEMNISQYDMLVTQVAFVGLAVLHPEKVGMKLSEEDLEALLHFWRGIGYLLGVEDRFNLCTGDVNTVRAYCREILHKEMVVAAVDAPIREASQMSHGIVQGVKAFVPLLTYHALIKYLYEIFEIERPVPISSYAKIGFYAMKFTYSRAAHYAVFLSIFGSLLRFSLWLTNLRRNIIARRLERRHKLCLGQYIGDVPSGCPMSVNMEDDSMTNNNIPEIVA